MPGALAALRRVRADLPAIQPPGMIEIATPAAPGEAPLLRTRLTLAGDVVTVIAAPFLALPAPERNRIGLAHRAAIAAALEALATLQRAGLALAGGMVAAGGAAAWGAAAQAGLEALPALAVPLALGAASWLGRRRLLPWFARRLGARVLAPPAGGTPSRTRRLDPGRSASV